MEHLLFAGYLVLFAWLVTRISFFTRSGLTNAQLIILFLLKVMAGIFYGWIGAYYGQMAQMIDTWAYHVEGLEQYKLLLKDPLEFVANLFHTTYESGYANFLSTHDSWWNDVKANLLIKLMAVFDVFTFGHYYINVIFICFLTFFGSIGLYRVMQDVFSKRRIEVLLAAFLVPSFLYWTSGLHKEGLIFTGIVLMVFHIYFGFRTGSFGWKRIFAVLIGFSLVLILRNFLIITLLPPLFAWILCEKLKARPVPVFGTTILLFIILFFSARFIHPRLDFPQATVIKQSEFLELGGGSAVAVDTLEPTVGSFVRNLPQAIALSMLRPYPSDVKHLLSLAAAVEINFLLLLVPVFVIWRRRDVSLTPFLFFCLSFGFAVLFMVGYTVNILGAIVRYRSIVLPFLIVPLIAQIDWNRIGRLIAGNIDKK